MILIFLLVTFLSLFILYAVSRHDFVLLRQSISLRQVYDNVFIGLIVFFITSRIGFAIYSQTLDVLHPLKFFYLSKFWGLLPSAGFLGMILVILILFRKKKNKLRILDIYLISFSPLILLDILLHGNSPIQLIIKIVASVVLIAFYGWFIKIHNKFTTKDGFITCMTIITYSLVLLALSIATNGILSQKFAWFNIALGISTVGSCLLLFLVQRDTFNKQ